jgi:hypothetical protein
VKHTRNFIKRIFYNYFLRDMSIASIELLLGFSLLLFGGTFGAYEWWYSAHFGQAATAGTVMLSAMPLLIGLQFVVAFLGHDIASVPIRPFHRFPNSRK